MAIFYGLLKEKIRYLFPYEMVSPGDDIYLYGGGDLGRQYLDEIARGNYCNVMGVIDKDIKKCIVVHEHLFYLNEFNFSGIEKIIISIVDAKIAEDVKQDLIKRGVKESNIIWKIHQLN